MKKTLKKYGIYIGTAIGVFLIVVLCMFLYDKYKVNKMLNKFDKAYSSNEKSIIFYASATCHFCDTEKPILKQIAKDYDLDYVELDISLLSKKQKEDINKKLKIEGATPTISIVKDKEVLYTNVGYLDGQDLVDFFIEVGLIEEGSKYLPEDNLIFMNYEELLDFENGIVIVGYTSNPDSNKVKTNMNKISKKYDLDVYYYNFGKLDEFEFYASYDYLDEINTNDFELYDGNALAFPMIFVIEDGEIKDVIKDTDENKIIKALGL